MSTQACTVVAMALDEALARLQAALVIVRLSQPYQDEPTRPQLVAAISAAESWVQVAQAFDAQACQDDDEDDD